MWMLPVKSPAPHQSRRAIRWLKRWPGRQSVRSGTGSLSLPAAEATKSRATLCSALHSENKPGLQQLVQSDRQVSNALARRVKNCVADGRGRAGYTDFAKSSRAKRGVRIGYAGVENFDARDIQVHRNMIFRERGIHDAAPALIE